MLASGTIATSPKNESNGFSRYWPVVRLGRYIRPIPRTSCDRTEYDSAPRLQYRAISYATLCEAHTLILRKLGGAYSRLWLSEVLAGAHLLNPEVADYSSAAEGLERFPDQLITLVDAVTATMSRRLDVAVWTFDRHFTTMRSVVWAK